MLGGWRGWFTLHFTLEGTDHAQYIYGNRDICILRVQVLEMIVNGIPDISVRVVTKHDGTGIPAAAGVRMIAWKLYCVNVMVSAVYSTI